MATVNKLERVTLDRELPHMEVDCTYSVITDERGAKHLQIDTYGSTQRQIPNKKSQSIRFTPEAIEQLRQILASL